MGVAVKLIKTLFAYLFLICVLSFAGSIVMSEELFECEMVMNIYNRFNPCTERQCVEDCGRNYGEAENVDECVSVADLKGGNEYDEIIDEEDVTTAGNNNDIDNYVHMVGCCGIQFAADDDAAGIPSDEEGGSVEANQGRPKFSCSVAFLDSELSCVNIECIKDCSNRGFRRARCLEFDEIASHIQYPPDQIVDNVEDQAVEDNALLDDSNPNNTSNKKGCCCDPVDVSNLH